MIRMLSPSLAMLIATPLAAHETTGFAHLHPHGSEVILATLFLVVGAAVLWRLLRRG